MDKLSIGHKESEEALVAFIDLVLLSADVLKDGFQMGDIQTVWQKVASDPVLAKELLDGWNGLDKAPLEIKEFNFLDIFALVQKAVAKLKK